MKKCPFCAEEIQDAAIKCRYCGSTLRPTSPVPTVSQEEPTGATSPSRQPSDSQSLNGEPEDRPAAGIPQTKGRLDHARYGLAAIFAALVMIALFVFVTWVVVRYGGAPHDIPTEQERPAPPASASQTSVPEEEDKAHAILFEQKTKAESLQREAVALVRGDRLVEAKRLYQARLKELGALRKSVKADRSLSPSDRDRIDEALRVEQESTRSILAEYESLFGR